MHTAKANPDRSNFRRVLPRWGLGTLLILTAASCESPTAPGPDAHIGTFVMTSVNGNTLPWTFTTTGDFTVTVLAGSITLDTDGSFSDTEVFRLTDENYSTDDVDTTYGVYERVGTRLNFVSSRGREFTAELEGEQLTLTDQALTAVYRRH